MGKRSGNETDVCIQKARDNSGDYPCAADVDDGRVAHKFTREKEGCNEKRKENMVASELEEKPDSEVDGRTTTKFFSSDTWTLVSAASRMVIAWRGSMSRVSRYIRF